MGDSNTAIRVAIIGGGLTGVTLLRGLMRYRHIAADLYESRPSFKEETPGIELSALTQDILQLIDPSILSCLDRSGAIYTTADCYIATGPLAGQRVDFTGQSNIDRTVSRQALLTELLEGIPPRMVHLNTRLDSIMEGSPGKGLTLIFSDRTQKRYDVVIGADGIQGKTRAHVVGPKDPAQVPKPSGFWNLPIKVSVNRARQMIGAENFDSTNPRQVTWIGHGTTMQHNLINASKDVQISITGTFDGTNEEFAWAKLFSPEEFQQIFSQNMLPPCQGMVKLAQSVYTIQIAGICQIQHVPTRTYTSKNVVLMGDAAHGMLSSHEALSGLAFEEVLILVTLLGRTTSRSSISSALRAYDEVCRPRAETVISAAHDISLLMTGRAPGIGLNPVPLAEALRQKWGSIENLNLNAHCMAALGAMNRNSPPMEQWQ
ncbi:hypothetical protein BKA67DRAFT_663862 [Truncatella angustata]|uniref:FAD-binding domain-containing protein n=1 Tax=Truncatella angustata TaxID=152316 RepID=A0A9P8RKJ1_9PEZI|nr:uncharacterized protein BKA67DRAFT_663862 [Truncatella angustata]KAH6645988.1 hypothetical protein BKA67DRAFT_663862 [Truncatella angustata]KAH8205484.1 hypothetical protein TruAng_000390 [Truncatella angustata]